MPEPALQAGVVVLVQLTRVSLELTRFCGHLVSAGMTSRRPFNGFAHRADVFPVSRLQDVADKAATRL